MITTSDKTDQILPALLKARQSFGALVPNKTNPAFRSRYIDLAGVVGATEPALLAAGILVVQGSGVHEGVVTCQTRLIHASSGQWIEATVGLDAATPQKSMGALTYGRRGSLCSVLAVVADEDDDGNTATRSGPTPPRDVEEAAARAKAASEQRAAKPPADGPAEVFTGRLLTSRFNGKCHVCGGEMSKGDNVLYNGKLKRAAHPECGVED